MTVLAEQMSPRWLALGFAGSAAILGALAGFDPRVAIVVACGIGFAVIALMNLTLGTCIFATVWYFSEVLGSNLPVTKLMGIVLVGSWLAMATVGRLQHRRLFESNRFLYVLVLFIVWAGASALWAEHPGPALASISRYVPNAMLFLIFYAAIKKRDDAMMIVGAMVIGALLGGAYGLINPEFGEDPGRLSGALGNANATAASMVMALVLLGGLFGALRDRPWPRGIVALAIPLPIIGLLLTVSRGGIVGLAAVLIATFALAGPWRKRLFALAAVALLGVVIYFAVLAPTGARERITHPADGTGRVDIWTVGWRMVESNPIKGVGAGNFSTSTVHYLLKPGIIQRDDFIVDNPKVAHNTYLQILAELGIIGLTLFLVLVIWALSFVFKAIKAFDLAGDRGMAILSRAVLIALIGYLAGAFFDAREYASDLWLLLSLGPALLALAQAQLNHRQPEEEISSDGMEVRPEYFALPA